MSGLLNRHTSVGTLPTALTRDLLATFHRRLLRGSLRVPPRACSLSQRFQRISRSGGINHRAERTRLVAARGSHATVRPTKCQGDRVRCAQAIEPADPDDAFNANVAAVRAAHGAELAARSGARADARTFPGG